MSSSPRTDAPRLPGLSFIEPIGTGGFSQVYLYEQRRPRRPVAVKLLDVDTLSQQDLDSYAEEANVMAMVSAHPYIVQVFHADVSPTGQPYFVMEYYSGLNYLQRCRQEKISVPEVLRVGVQLASAIEVAHRAGIHHRDIKPANVLTNEYRNPGLTDFGIAAVGGLQTDAGRDGLSIPWSPPEAIDDGILDHRSDVYSLAATLYTMLAGRAPFEIVGGDNRTLAMMHRIRQGNVAETGRDDVPESLERVLAGAMAKRPASRPQSAMAFGQQLQHIESELQLAITALELPEEPAPVRNGDDASDVTRAKAARPFEVEPPAAPSVMRPVGPRRSVAAVNVVDQPGGAGLDDTVGRVNLPKAPDLPTPRTHSKWEIIVPLVALCVAVVLLIGGWALSRNRPEPLVAADAPTGAQQNNDHFENRLNEEVAPPSPVSPLPVNEVIGTSPESGNNTFRWAAVEGARYQVVVDGMMDYEIIDVPQYETFGDCVSVRVVAPNNAMSAPTRGCVPGTEGAADSGPQGGSGGA